MKKILISTVAAAMVTSSLMAAAQNSNIYFGNDINGTVQSLTVVSGTADYNVTAGVPSNAVPATGAGSQGISYIPEIGIGEGNLITVKIDNGYVYDTTNNELYLVDANDTADSNAQGKVVAAKMTDFVSSTDGKGYSQMTFKFEKDVVSKTRLVMVETSEANATTRVGSITATKLAVRAQKGLSCGDAVKLSVINSTDQSGGAFPVANAPTAEHSTVNVFNALALGQAVIVNSTSANRTVQGTAAIATGNLCPTWTCQVALPSETSFGGVAGNAATCPTCTPVTTPTLLCGTAFAVVYTASTTPANDVAVTTIDYTMTTTDTSAVTSFQTYATANLANALTVTPSSNVYSASVGTAEGYVGGSNSIFTDITVDGTTVIAPRSFDLAVKANTSIDIDGVANFLSFTEQATTLGVSYLSANPDYRSFVRVTSSSAGAIQAIVTTEDGSSSARVDVTQADGTAVEIGANGGAVVVEAADLLRSAQDAGFAGTGMRFNASIFVKSTGTVDAVAYQTANGSQRYLPVSGATGGVKSVLSSTGTTAGTTVSQ